MAYGVQEGCEPRLLRARVGGGEREVEEPSEGAARLCHVAVAVGEGAHLVRVRA